MMVQLDAGRGLVHPELTWSRAHNRGCWPRFRESVIHPGLARFGVLNIFPVIVCHCHGVSDRRIRTEARLGAGCPDELASRCGAGDDCGGCMPFFEDLILDMSAGDGTPVRLAS